MLTVDNYLKLLVKICCTCYGMSEMDIQDTLRDNFDLERPFPLSYKIEFKKVTRGGQSGRFHHDTNYIG